MNEWGLFDLWFSPSNQVGLAEFRFDLEDSCECEREGMNKDPIRST